jgi:hypothetical protein
MIPQHMDSSEQRLQTIAPVVELTLLCDLRIAQTVRVCDKQYDNDTTPLGQ